MATSPAYLMTSAEAWDAANLRFTDLSGNGRHGARTVSPSAWTPLIPAGTVSVGSVTGNGAGFSIPFAGGTASTTIYWPVSSIPSTFTICSITRYSGAAKQEIMNAGDTWKQGHHSDKAGTVYYGSGTSQIANGFMYTLSVKTNWVIACGRNIYTPGAISTIVNGVVTSTAAGGSLGNGRLAINGIDPIYGSDWQLSRLYVWNGHLSNAEFAEASAKLNSYVAGELKNCVPSIACSCNTGYTGPDTGASKGQCTTCPAGTYKPTNGSAACTSCAVNANSSVGSTNVSACSCNPGYTGPDVGPCVACAAGAAKSVSGSAACGVCPADTFSNTSAASVCTACPTGFKALSGTTTSVDCCGLNSSPTCLTVPNVIASYSTTACARFIALTPKPSFASISTRNNAAVGTIPTYNAAGGPNGKGHVSFDRTKSQYLDAGSRTFNFATNGGVTIVAVVRFTQNAGFYEMILDMGNSNNNNNILISRAGYTANLHVDFVNGGSQICGWDPIGVIVQNSWLTLVVSYQSSTNMCSVTANGVVSNRIASSPLTDRTVSKTWIGQGLNMESWGGAYLNADLAGVFVVDEYLGTTATTAISNAMIEGVDLTSAPCDKCSLCSCNTGYTGPDTGASKGQCTTCPAGTYKSTNGSAACSLCPANTYSTAVGATSNGTCVSCPSNSESGAGSTGCVCSFGYTGEMASCAACVPGKYKMVLGTSACIACPANTQAPGAATPVCSSLAGFSGLGYALDDVARSCGSALSGTCKTLSNGATSNAVGTTDGALDGSASTFVSVAFNPNLARSCGSKGTDACVASYAPAMFGGASLANDGNTNTQSQTDYGTAREPYIRPYWGVDFGQRRTVFAVKLLSSDQWWQYLKDFKIVVGNVADAQSPLNAVCADYLNGAGSSYVTFTCEDTMSGRYLYVVNGPHLMSYLSISEVVVEAFNYAAAPALMQPWWAVDFEVERAVAGVVIQTQAAAAVQVRVGLSADPLQNAVCGSGTMLVGVNNTITCATGMVGRYLSVIGAGNSVLVLNEVRVAGAAASACCGGTFKPLVGNFNCTACPAFSVSVVGATAFSQCSCNAPYF